MSPAERATVRGVIGEQRVQRSFEVRLEFWF
jgi:hypothetical protein